MCCVSVEIIFKKECRGPKERLLTWCSDKHEAHSQQRQGDCGEEVTTLKCGYFTHIICIQDQYSYHSLKVGSQDNVTESL